MGSGWTWLQHFQREVALILSVGEGSIVPQDWKLLGGLGAKDLGPES